MGKNLVKKMVKRQNATWDGETSNTMINRRRGGGLRRGLASVDG